MEYLHFIQNNFSFSIKKQSIFFAVLRFCTQFSIFFDCSMNFSFIVCHCTFPKYPRSIRKSRFTIGASLRSRFRTLHLAAPRVVGLSEIYSCDYASRAYSRKRGPRAISCIRVEKWKRRGWKVASFLYVVYSTFLADPHRVAWNRDLMAAKITMTLKGEIRRQFHRKRGRGRRDSTGDDSRQRPRSCESRFMRASFAART